MSDGRLRDGKDAEQVKTAVIALIIGTGVLINLGAMGFGRFSMSLIFPYMRQGLDFSYSQIGMAATGNFLGYLFFSLAAGILASRWGSRRVITASLMLLGGAMALTGFSNSFRWTFICLFLVGVGTAGTMIPTMVMVASWVSARRRGIVSGILTVGTAVGTIISGYAIPLWVTAPGGGGWRDAWIWLGVICMAIALWAGIVLRDRPSQERSNRPEAGQPLSFWLGIINILKEKPVLFRLAMIYFAFGFSYIIFTTYFGIYLMETRGWTTFETGRLWKWVGIFSLPGGFLWGWVSDKVGRRWGLFILCLLHGLCLINFALLPWKAGIAAAALLYGVCIHSIPAVMNAACVDEAGPGLAPTAFGAVTFVFSVGQIAAPSFAGFMLDWGWSMSQNLSLSAVVAFLGAVCAYFMHTSFSNPKKENKLYSG